MRTIVRVRSSCSCSLTFSIRSIRGGGICTTASMILSWNSSLVWKKSLLVRGIYTSGQVTYIGSPTLQDHMRHALQHSHGRTTHAYKGANHLANLEIRAALLRVNNAVQRCARPNATIRSAKCSLWIWSCSKVRGDLIRPFYRIKQMRCIVQRKQQTYKLLNLRSPVF